VPFPLGRPWPVSEGGRVFRPVFGRWLAYCIRTRSEVKGTIMLYKALVLTMLLLIVLILGILYRSGY
jgi:hypothetical protein